MMKKFFAYVEDLWVAVTFAEAGEYESTLTEKIDITCPENESVHAH